MRFDPLKTLRHPLSLLFRGPSLIYIESLLTLVLWHSFQNIKFITHHIWTLLQSVNQINSRFLGSHTVLSGNSSLKLFHTHKLCLAIDWWSVSLFELNRLHLTETKRQECINTNWVAWAEKYIKNKKGHNDSQNSTIRCCSKLV